MNIPTINRNTMQYILGVDIGGTKCTISFGDAAEAGDDLAKEIYDICGRFLGMGLSILIDVLNLEMIMLIPLGE